MSDRPSRFPSLRRLMLAGLALAPCLAPPLAGQKPSKSGPARARPAMAALGRPKATGASTTLLPGLNARGELDSSDPVMAVDTTPYEVWTYRGRTGEALTVTMRSARADAFLMVMRQNNDKLETLASDDDGLGGGTTDAGVRLTLPADGEYMIVANASAVLGKQYLYGPYTLEVVSSRGAADWGALYPGGGDAGGKYAVVVGISDYPGEEEDLNGPRQDAAMFRDVLVSRYGFAEQNVVTLTDRNGNRDQIINAFRRYLSQAGPSGTVVFYYSGHGTQLDENALLTGADDPERDGKDEAIYVWDSGAEEKGSFILDDELGILANEQGAGRVLIVLDACYSGTGSRAPGGTPKLALYKDIKGLVNPPASYLQATGRARGKSVASMAGEPTEHLLLAASSDTEVSWTARGWPNRGGLASVFTYYLVEAMAQAPAGTTVADLMSGVGRQTTEYAQRTYGKTQTPQAEGSRKAESLAAYLGR
jgi:hypothetical protein